MANRRTAAPSKTVEAQTPEGLRDLLAHLLAGVVGGTEAGWHKLVGEAETLTIVSHPQSNRRAEPIGTPEKREAIKKAVQLVHEDNQYVTKPVIVPHAGQRPAPFSVLSHRLWPKAGQVDLEEETAEVHRKSMRACLSVGSYSLEEVETPRHDAVLWTGCRKPSCPLRRLGSVQFRVGFDESRV